jgi:hypothetical protein
MAKKEKTLERKIKKKGKTTILEIYRSSDYNITGTIRKISMK